MSGRVGFRRIELDGAAVLFHPETGTQVRFEAPETASLRQRAPRSVQFGITNACNLACAFCSRDLGRASTWSVDDAFALLAELDVRGVSEVAFGGGEPLVFPGFFELVDRLVAETRLAVHLTTNGLRLGDQEIERLRGKIGEVRLSLYEENAWERTVSRLVSSDLRFGVNQLVDGTNVAEIGARLDRLMALGCRDVLLLPVLGETAVPLTHEQSAHLRDELRARMERSSPPTLKLGVCWGDALNELPRLYARSDCGAGRDFLEVTSDRRVRACSFHHRRLPFEDADDVIRIWRDARAALDARAECLGCPRGAATEVGSATSAGRPRSVRVFRAFASNNSGSYTLLGSFQSVDDARVVAEELAAMATRMDTFLDRLEGPNPLALLLREAGIEVDEAIAIGDSWPEYGDSPEAVRIGSQVWWFAAYTVTMPKEIGALERSEGE